MNEEFAIKLKTILDNSSVQVVKRQIQDLQNSISQTTNGAKNASKINSAVNNTNSIGGIKQYTAQIEILQQRLNDIEATLNMDNSDGFLSKTDIVELNAEAEKLRNKIIDLQNRGNYNVDIYARLKDSIKAVNKDFLKIINNAKKFTLSLIGARSVWAGIRKAMHTYLAQNEELQNKINECWYALGSLFAPILEWIVNLFSKVVVYVDAIAKKLGFAGVNMSNFGKETKKANKSLAGFDELNNLDSSSNNNAQSSSFEFGNVDVSWVDDIKENLSVILPLLAAVAGAIAAIKLGLSGIQALGIALIIIGICETIKAVIKYLENPTWENFGNILTGITIILGGLAIAFGSVPLAIAAVVVAVIAVLSRFHDQIIGFFTNIESKLENALTLIREAVQNNNSVLINVLLGFVERVFNTLKTMISTIRILLDGLLTGIRQIVDGIIQIFKGNLKTGIQTALNGILTIFKSIFNSIWNLVRGILNNIISGFETMVNSGIKALNKLLNAVASLGSKLLSLIGISGISIPNISTVSLPRLATGTNYVPNDMIAELHQGEAVVPKAFNEQQFNNSEETNELLRQLINVVDSKEFRTYISQSEIGKASVDYINKQSRILGGSLV